MNSIQALCPKCDQNVPLLLLSNNNTEVKIKCKCGDEETIPLKDYINKYEEKEKSKKVIKYKNTCEQDKDEIKNYYCSKCSSYHCAKCKHHGGDYDQSGNSDYHDATFIPEYLTCNPLQTVNEFENIITNYFPSFKQEYLSKIKDSNIQNKLNELYEKSLSHHKEILSFLKILVKNYREDNYNSAINLEKNTYFNISKFSGDYLSEKDISNYLEKYCINRYFNTFTGEPIERGYYTFQMLDDGRLFAVDSYQNAFVLDPKNNYNIVFEFQYGLHLGDICKLEDGNIALCAKVENKDECEVKIFKIKETSAECVLTIEKTEAQLKALPNNRLALGCSNCIMIYDFSQGYTKNLVKKIEHTNMNTANNFWYSKAKNVIFRQDYPGNCYVWNMSSYEKDTEVETFLNNIFKKSITIAKEVKDNAMICYSSQNIEIINLQNLTVEKIFYRDEYSYIFDMIVLRDQNTVIFTNNMAEFYELNLEKKILTKKKFDFYERSSSKFEIVNEHTFILIEEGLIKEYQY